MQAFSVRKRRMVAGLGWAGLSAIALLAMAAIQAAPAQAATWYAANNGLDTSPCTKTVPCRSITRALAVASPGDTIQVGAGVYGDLDGSGTVGDAPGEETSAGCMISIAQRVTIVSKDGARSTVLDAGGDSAVHSVVCIQGAGTNGTVFGKLGKGFTLTGSTLGGIIGGAGLTVSANDGVRVEGNWATNNAGFGFALLPAPTNTTLKSNIASDNGMSGVFGQADGLVLTGNLARNNSGSGFEIYSSASAVITKNVAVGNLAPGFRLYSPGTATVSKNTAVGNQIGLHVIAHGAVTLSSNNLFGNGDGVLPPSGPNCGLFLQNDDAVNPLTVNASGNFWGAATGPGANPADLAGGTGCSSDAGGGMTLTTAPVATAKLPLYPPKMK